MMPSIYFIVFLIITLFKAKLFELQLFALLQ
jgi:hypothetical protein